MPGSELRRQRRAFIKGALRTGLVAAVVLAAIAGLAWKARSERDRANYEVYVASMNLMRPTWEQNNLEHVQELLESTRNNPARGWEWDYWYRMSHLNTSAFPKPLATTYNVKYSPNGKVYLREEGRIWEFTPASGQLVNLMPMMGQTGGILVPFADGRRVLEWDGVQTAQIIDVPNRKRLAKLMDYGYWGTECISADGRWVVGGRLSEWSGGSVPAFRSAVLWNVETGESTSLPTSRARWFAMSPDGKTIAASEVDPSRGVTNYHVVIREFGTWRILASLQPEGIVQALVFSPKSDRLATSSWGGLEQMWDLKTRREIARTQPSDKNVYRLEFSPDGAWLATSAIERVGRLYDVLGPRMRLLAETSTSIILKTLRQHQVMLPPTKEPSA